MWPRYSRNALLAAVLALAPACQEQGDAPQVQLITTACEGLQPLEGATHLRVRVTGEGLDTPIERITPVNLRPEDMPDIPAGAARVLEVRAYSGEPTQPGPGAVRGPLGSLRDAREGRPVRAPARHPAPGQHLRLGGERSEPGRLPGPDGASRRAHGHAPGGRPGCARRRLPGDRRGSSRDAQLRRDPRSPGRDAHLPAGPGARRRAAGVPHRLTHAGWAGGPAGRGDAGGRRRRHGA